MTKILVKLKQERPGVRERARNAVNCSLAGTWASLGEFGAFEELSLHPSVALITAF